MLKDFCSIKVTLTPDAQHYTRRPKDILSFTGYMLGQCRGVLSYIFIQALDGMCFAAIPQEFSMIDRIIYTLVMLNV
jgi:hypothetical protein